jgi:ATP-binding cassette subfamily C protein CydC
MDEPTEGLDENTALAVLAGIRAYLPAASILTASHRPAEIGWADRVIQLDQSRVIARAGPKELQPFR